MICAVELQIKVSENKTEGNRRNNEVFVETLRRAEIAATRGKAVEIFHRSRLIPRIAAFHPLFYKEIRHSYCWLTVAQVVEWPVGE